VTELCCKNTAEIELSGGARIPIDLDFVFSDTRKFYFPSLFLPDASEWVVYQLISDSHIRITFLGEPTITFRAKLCGLWDIKNTGY
jgi:hypothetical protein